MLEDAYALSADFGGADRAGNVSAEHFQPAAVGLANETADFLRTVGARIHHRHRCSPAFEELQEIRKEYYSKKKSLYHYWHMASSNYENYLQGEEVRIKKYFYVIRPLLAAKWIADHGTQPPMLFRELLDAELPEELRAIVNELLDKKQKMPEMRLAPKIKELDCFIKKELETIRLAADQAETDRNTWDTLNRYFMKQVTERPALNPYEMQPSIGIDLIALTRYAKANGKTLTELSETEINLFRNGGKETC